MEQTKLKEINAALPRVNIKGKQYVMVKDRITAFRALYPEWSILTEILTDDGVVVTVKTTITDQEGRVRATAHAQEKYNSTPINRTSALENSETSSIGRALGLLGIGIDDSFASANEIETAQAQQDAGERWPDPGDKISGAEVAKLRALLGEEQRVENALKYYHLESLADMTYQQYRDCFKKMGARKGAFPA